MKKLLLVFSFLSLSFHFSYSQNLVPNPSFEQYSGCPTVDCGISLATGWYSAGYTPDYYNTCASWASGVPTNAVGYQYPASGNAYAGIGTYVYNNIDVREYLATKLISPLDAGKKYFVSFKVSLIDRFVYCATNKMGALFSTVSYALGNDSCNNVQGLLPQNFAHIYSAQIITDTANWTTVSGSFTADSAYQYIIIGNHFDDNNTDTICWGSNIAAGYIIDDIYVSSDSVNGIIQSNIEQNVAVYPTVTDDIVVVQINIQAKASISIYDLFGRLITSKNISPLARNPISLLGYDAGIYLMSVNIDNKIISKKIILTK